MLSFTEGSRPPGPRPCHAAEEPGPEELKAPPGSPSGSDSSTGIRLTPKSVFLFSGRIFKVKNLEKCTLLIYASFSLTWAYTKKFRKNTVLLHRTLILARIVDFPWTFFIG